MQFQRIDQQGARQSIAGPMCRATNVPYAECEYWHDEHIVKDGTGRGCVALASKQNWDGLKSLRDGVNVLMRGPDEMHAPLAGAREAFGLVLNVWIASSTNEQLL